ncbi:MAG: undecaprenyl/decaprenyl-phosphate alpha-N-acetylglucosaminyl 1-phosphate transferase [Candidatus Levybacteria bacterium]|nr:undecaprenyl/decaprenyl-phosphate alpha-N-acetylglucosaminyl 1-phosphate transferase [Candidatus Levybacteria bacterium]
MLDLNSIVFFPFLISLLVTCIAVPISLYFLKKYRVVDDPKRHKHPAVIHKNPVPRGGGIALFIGVFIASLIFIPFDKIIIAAFIAAFISLVAGVIDDKLDISPYVRFLINIGCAVFVVLMGANIPFITNPFGGILYLNTIQIPFLNIPVFSVMSDLIAVIWIVWVMNMLNWSKGVDGQMPGIVAISAIVIGILSLRFSIADQLSITAATLSFIIAGASLGFLVFNFYPAKIFPGYGATAIYLLLAVASILSSAKLATAILVMGIPMTDGLFTILRRILSGKSPFWHDKKHLHHLLLGLGFSQRSVAAFYWIVSAILGGLSLVLSSQGKLFAIIMLVIVAFGGILFLQILIRRINDKTRF